MKKALKIIGFVVLFMVIVIVIATFWLQGLKEDLKKTRKKMEEITNAYGDFNKYVDDFSNLRMELYGYEEDLTNSELATNAKAWNNFIEKYTTAIEKVETSSKDLKHNCKEEYGRIDVISKCNSFNANYEAAHNYYITDIKNLNKIIDKYEVWRKKNRPKSLVIKKGLFPVYSDYIDYDLDGEFFGKEEVENGV